jgi:hypothetical protein
MLVIDTIYPYTSLEVSFTVLLQKLLRNFVPTAQANTFPGKLLQTVMQNFVWI